MVYFCAVRSFENEDFLESSRIMSCLVQLNSVLFNLLCVLDQKEMIFVFNVVGAKYSFCLSGSLYMLLFIERTPSLSCVKATLKQYISKSERYFYASNFVVVVETAIRYISFFVPNVSSPFLGKHV